MQNTEDMTREQLIDYINKLEAGLKIYQKERDRYYHARPEYTGAFFLAGGYGNRDNNFLPQYVEIVPAYGAGWSQIYEKTKRTISFEGS